MRIVATLSLLLLGLTACASTGAERNLASATSSQVVAHQGQVNAFVAAQTDLNAENAAELDSFVEATAGVQAASTRTLQTWRLSGQQPLLDQAAVVSTVAPTDILAALGTSQTVAAALSDEGSGAALDTVNTALKKLAARPKARQQFAELVEAYSSVSTALGAIQTSATTATAPSKGAAATPAK